MEKGNNGCGVKSRIVNRKWSPGMKKWGQVWTLNILETNYAVRTMNPPRLRDQNWPTDLSKGAISPNSAWFSRYPTDW